MVERDPLRHHRGHRSPNAFGDSRAEIIAEKVADGLGTTFFVVISTAVIIVWILINALSLVKFDKYPFILLNLGFSAQAFYTGALVIIAQKAQAKKDNAKESADAQHREELAQQHTEALHQNTYLTQEVHKQTQDVHELVSKIDKLLTLVQSSQRDRDRKVADLCVQLESLEASTAKRTTAKPTPAKRTTKTEGTTKPGK